jgi:hypothetical protein
MPDAERYRVELVNPVDLIFRDLADGRVTQESVAITYAFIMRQEPDADWWRINAAICRRWKGATALERVKRMAWKRM